VSVVRPFRFCFALGLALLAAAPPVAVAAEAGATLQRRIDQAIATTPVIDGAIETQTVRAFYAGRGRLAWGGQAARISGQIPQVVRAEGLDLRTYALPSSGGDEVEADVRLTTALARLGRHIAVGRVTPDRDLGGFGGANRNSYDGVRFLRLVSEGKSLEEAAAQVQPPFVGYLRLKDAQEHLRELARAGGWPTLPTDLPKLVPGETSDERIPLLRRRLIASGDLDPAESSNEAPLYDGAVVEGVRHFQRRHGLEPDGTVGARTLATLNVPVEARLSQLAANLERWRWMPHQLGRRHVSVNIPATSLDLVEDGAVTLSMRVVVGDTRHPTPSMDSRMSSVVLNPPWSVPSSIVEKEILPKLRRDPNYLASNNLQIVDYPQDSPESAGDGIDWNGIGKRFPRLRQPPGPDNALGQMKFNLSNADDIYLHDTPNHRVFSRAYRALSHGCVRLDDPVALGEALMGARWQGRLASNLSENPSTRTVPLEHTIPVYLVYFTAWTDPAGEINFRDDLYGHDRRLGTALRQARNGTTSPPAAAPRPTPVRASAPRPAPATPTPAVSSPAPTTPDPTPAPAPAAPPPT